MKVIIMIAVLCALGINTIRAEKMISDLFMQDGNTYSLSETTFITNDSPLTLSRLEYTYSGSWELHCLQYDGKWKDFSQCLKVSGNDCVFSANSVTWANAKHAYDNEHDSYYFICKIVYRVYSNKYDIVNLKLALLPDIPSIENVQLDIVYNWDVEYPLPKQSLLTFDVKYNNTKRLYLHSAYDRFYDVSEKPRSLTVISDLKDILDDNAGCTTYNVEDVDWGECFAIRAANRYGSVMSDTLNTTDYVKDPQLIDYINRYWNSQSGVIDISECEKDIVIENNVIRCPSGINMLYIYTSTGIIVEQYDHPETISLSDLSKGLYIITYISNSGINKSIKYLKP